MNAFVKIQKSIVVYYSAVFTLNRQKVVRARSAFTFGRSATALISVFRQANRIYGFHHGVPVVPAQCFGGRRSQREPTEFATGFSARNFSKLDDTNPFVIIFFLFFFLSQNKMHVLRAAPVNLGTDNYTRTSYNARAASESRHHNDRGHSATRHRW